MKYLITGGAGFIGSNLADNLLQDGHDVCVIDNFNDYYDVKIKEANVSAHLGNPHYHLYRADIENMTELQKNFATQNFDAVIHLAARAGVRPSLERPLDYVNTSIWGTVNILEIFNLGGGEPITLKQMIETIEKTLGKKAKIEHLPMQPGDVEKTVCDYSKANRLLNYQPKTTFADGIRKYVLWKHKM